MNDIELRDYFAGKAMQAILSLGAGYGYTSKPEGATVTQAVAADAYSMADAMLAARGRAARPDDLPVGGSQAVLDVLAERRRQTEVEGFTPGHDASDFCELEMAAACYAGNAGGYVWAEGWPGEAVWPWSKKWWKPTTPRRDLVKAGALVLAAIERRDRAAAASPDADGWVDWHGGDCPVADDTLVEVMGRCGESDTDRASAFRWWHGGNGYDTIRYRIVEGPSK